MKKKLKITIIINAAILVFFTVAKSQPLPHVEIEGTILDMIRLETLLFLK